MRVLAWGDGPPPRRRAGGPCLLCALLFCASGGALEAAPSLVAPALASSLVAPQSRHHRAPFSAGPSFAPSLVPRSYRSSGQAPLPLFGSLGGLWLASSVLC